SCCKAESATASRRAPSMEMAFVAARMSVLRGRPPGDERSAAASQFQFLGSVPPAPPPCSKFVELGAILVAFALRECEADHTGTKFLTCGLPYCMCADRVAPACL